MYKKKYGVVDCETGTLPFVNEIAITAEQKKKIAIAKPLIYDIGWVICNRDGYVYKKEQYLIAETFSVPAIFNTAYYAEKRPIYLDMLKRGEITIKPWNEVIALFEKDMENVDSVGAFNSMFDFKKAIPFTDLYIKKLYSPDYYKWEQAQQQFAKKIIDNKVSETEREFDPLHFVLRGKTYNLFDIWGLAAIHLLNNNKYKKQCVDHELFTNSGVYFKTSAEAVYRYLCKDYDFIESHTALDDALIETLILSRIAAKHKVAYGIEYFPFKKLGETLQFVQRREVPDIGECEKVYNVMLNYVAAHDGNNYVMSLINKINELADYANRMDWRIEP